ncbi:MAG: diguanylate cyclase [Salinispira sp.]
MKPKILFITDNNEIRDAVHERFSPTYDFTFAETIGKGLKLITHDALFFTILATYQGDKTIKLFKKSSEILPTSGRIMISDAVDLPMAFEAINVGKVFGLFQNPIDLSELSDMLQAAAVEYDRYRRIHLDTLTDPLTSLYNRRFIDRELNRVLESAQRHKSTFAIIFGDINRFKNINDTYGHTNGDLLLKNIATVLTRTCRGSDVLCRFGGDEFVVLIEKANATQTIRLIERLNAAMKELRLSEMKNEKFSLSLGYALFPSDSNTLEGMFKIADDRMYKVKHRLR